MGSHFRQLKQLLGGIFLVVILTIWSVIWLHVRDVRHYTEEEAGHQVHQTLTAFSTTAFLSLALADQALLRLQEVAQNDDLANFSEAGLLLARPGIGGPINRAALIGPDGIMKANFLNGAPAPLLDVRDRAYFQTFLKHPENRLFVSEPIQGKASKAWIILFSRPVLRDGQFAGVVFVGFEADALARLFDGFQRPDRLISLLSPQGRIIARSIGSEIRVGEAVNLEKLPRPGDPVRDYTSPLDQITRVSAISEVANWGLRVYVGIDRDAISAEQSRLGMGALLPAALLTLLLGAALGIIFRALSRLEKAETQAREAARRSQYILDNMTECVLLLDGAGHITFANPPALQLLGPVQGKAFEAALKSRELVLVTDEGAPLGRSNPVAVTCLQGGASLDGIWVGNTGQGKASDHWLALHGAPLFAVNGSQVTGAIVTLLERTDEHDRLNESAITQAILASMNDGVLVTSRQGAILAANAAFLRMHGFSLAELQGQQMTLLTTDPEDSQTLAAIWAQARTQDNGSGRIWYRHKDGSEICCWQTISAVRDNRRQVIRYVCVSRDITEQEARERELWRRANFDPLTELANRHRFDDRLSYALTQAERHERSFAVCYLDLDHFKQVNDRLGHAAGDALLRQTAQRMRQILREEDTLARIGGDEFALITPLISAPEDAGQVLGKLIQTLAEDFDLPEGRTRIGISGGIAIYPRDGRSAESLLAAADRALYAAKEGGRNTYRFAGDNPEPTGAHVQ